MEVQQGFMTDLYGLKRLYPATEEGVEQLIEEAIATTLTPSSPHHSLLTSASDIISIHEDEEALEDLLSAEEIPLQLGLVSLPPEIQHIYQEHQVVQQEALSHSPAHKIRFAFGTNSKERGSRYRTPTPYLRCYTRQRKVYVADKQKQRYEDAYNPDLDHHYKLYLHSHFYLSRLYSYPY